jgi:zinc-ribbon domain
MNYCPHCGNTIPVTAQHCPHCGKPLPRKKLSPIPFFVVGFMLLTVGGMWLGNYLKDQSVPPAQSTVAPASETAELPTQTPTATEIQPTRQAPTQTAIPPTNTAAVNLSPTPTFDWSNCHATYSTRLGIGASVVIGNFSSPFGYHVLSGPYKDSNTTGSISPGDKAKIINGPSCSNKWIWWIIKLDKNEVAGWIPEGDTDSFWLLPENGSSVDQSATISREVGEVNLRRSPGYANKNDLDDVIVKIPSGATVKLLEGPQIMDRLNWWYVEWNGYEGWIAERTKSGRTIMIFNP